MTHEPTQALIARLCALGARAPGSWPERQAADLVAARIRDGGGNASLRHCFVHRRAESVGLLHSVLAIAASLLSVYFPAPAFALLLVVAASCYLDLNGRAYLLRRLLFRRGSQNVVSPGPAADAPARLVLVAGCDAGRAGWLRGAASRRVQERLPGFLRGLASPYRLELWAGIAPLVPLLGLRLAGIDSTWIDAVQIVPTAILLVVAFALADFALSGTVPGAYRNASGVEAAIRAAEALRRDPPPRLDCWLVVSGGSASQGEGFRSFCRDRETRQRERPTFVIEVDAVGWGSPAYRKAQGAGIGLSPDDRLEGCCEGLPGIRQPKTGDAVVAQAAGFRALTVTCVDETGLAPAWDLSPLDLPDYCRPESVAAAAAAVESIARRLGAEIEHQGPPRVRALPRLGRRSR